ncbi:cytosolic 5'-nucleotidase 1A isoform X1 [Nematostella vectensis]|uniref:cytosolic 5'-nucleotidase 1A isoform X1 n=1 Tax=Nematostella vectensis TaxID=45351 RepID=UPI0013900BFA|nr:cytosolic 5'-nucleotidase 1A isoform X1 [Nematostella vectensis]
MDCVNGSISSSEVSASPRKAKELIKTLPGSDSSKTINVAVSSRALFDLEEENDLFVKKGLEDYIALQVRREDDMLKPGSAFPFIKKTYKCKGSLVHSQLHDLSSHDELNTSFWEHFANMIPCIYESVISSLFCSQLQLLVIVKIFGKK